MISLQRPQSLFWIFFGIFAGKLIISRFVPLLGDESYYWVWSQHLQLSYFDHPPMISWLFAIQNALSISEPRFFGSLLSSLTVIFWIKIFQDENPGIPLTPWIWVFITSPISGFGSFFMTPDMPLFFFWTASTWVALRILKTGHSRNLVLFASLGALLGLGFCSKYHIVLWALGAILYLVYRGQVIAFLRQNFFGLLIAVFIGSLFSSPVLVWNYMNDFSSFRFQFNHGLGGETWDWTWTLDYIAGQVIVLSPFIFWILPSLFRQKQKINTLHFFLGFFPLLFFLLSSIRGHVEMNWPFMSCFHLVLMSSEDLRVKLWKHRVLNAFIAFWVAMIGFFIWSNNFPSLSPIQGKFLEPSKYQFDMNFLEEYRPLYASSYQMASQLHFYSGREIQKLPSYGRFDFYDTSVFNLKVSPKFFLLKEDYQDLPSHYYNIGYRFKHISRPAPGFEIVLAEKVQ